MTSNRIFQKVGIIAAILLAFTNDAQAFTTFDAPGRCGAPVVIDVSSSSAPIFHEDTASLSRAVHMALSEIRTVKSILVAPDLKKTDPAFQRYLEAVEQVLEAYDARSSETLPAVSGLAAQLALARTELANGIESLSSWAALVRAVLPEGGAHVTVPARFVAEHPGALSRAIDVGEEIDGQLHLMSELG